MIKLLAISDNPYLTTGFSNVANQIYNGFIQDPEINLHVVGILENAVDKKNLKPYEVYLSPFSSGEDSMGFFLAESAIRFIKPDLIWIMIDPGNLLKYTKMIKELEANCPIIAYIPIEGTPIHPNFKEAIDLVEETGGQVVLWCDSAKRELEKQFGESNCKVIKFGSNHNDFIPFSKEAKNKLKTLFGFENSFMIMSGGVNKRTKGFDQVIDTARWLKKNAPDSNIKFYLHTEPEVYSMTGGFTITNQLEYYGVRDMFVLKPESNIKNGFLYKGIASAKTEEHKLAELEIPRPLTKEEQTMFFASSDLLARFNAMDAYLDLSQVEGWGMWPVEAMRCKLPVFGVKDYFVRDEIMGTSRIEIEPLPDFYWDTWTTGARLIRVNPEEVGKILIYTSQETLDKKAQEGYDRVSQLNWDDTRKQMNQLVREVINGNK